MNDQFVVKDSGNRQEFPTGSRRDTNEGKSRPDLVSPFFLERLGAHMQKGLAKYGEHNWAKGQPTARYLESAMRHLVQLLKGDRDEDHAAAVAFNIMGIVHNEECIRLGLLPAELGVLTHPWLEQTRTVPAPIDSPSTGIPPITEPQVILDFPPRTERDDRIDKLMISAVEERLNKLQREGIEAAKQGMHTCPYEMNSVESKHWWIGYHSVSTF